MFSTRKMLRKFSTVFLSTILLSQNYVFSGSKPSRSADGFIPVDTMISLDDENDNEIAFDADRLIEIKQKILKSKSKKDEDKIDALYTAYENAFHLFDSSKAYIRLLNICTNMASIERRAANKFLDKHIGDFFIKNPTVDEVQHILHASRSIRVIEKFFSPAIELIKTPRDYLVIMKPSSNNRSVAYKKLLTKTIRNSIETFMKTEPKIDEVMEVHGRIIELLVEEERGLTIATLIKLKEVFLSKFSGADKIWLMSYGVQNPSEEYRRQMGALKRMADESCKEQDEQINPLS